MVTGISLLQSNGIMTLNGASKVLWRSGLSAQSKGHSRSRHIQLQRTKCHQEKDSLVYERYFLIICIGLTTVHFSESQWELIGKRWYC
jgi:hypothetical protein